MAVAILAVDREKKRRAEGGDSRRTVTNDNNHRMTRPDDKTTGRDWIGMKVTDTGQRMAAAAGSVRFSKSFGHEDYNPEYSETSVRNLNSLVRTSRLTPVRKLMKKWRKREETRRFIFFICAVGTPRRRDSAGASPSTSKSSPPLQPRYRHSAGSFCSTTGWTRCTLTTRTRSTPSPRRR